MALLLGRNSEIFFCMKILFYFPAEINCILPNHMANSLWLSILYPVHSYDLYHINFTHGYCQTSSVVLTVLHNLYEILQNGDSFIIRPVCVVPL